MKYILIDDCSTDVYTSEFDNQADAISAGNDQFDRLTKSDLKRRKAFYVLESVNADENAENHFDGDIVKEWKVKA